MNKSKSKYRIKTRIYVPLIFILATLLITYVFPRQGKFKYSFNEGRPWRYGLLTAPFDFPIFKSQQQLEQDKTVFWFSTSLTTKLIKKLKQKQ